MADSSSHRLDLRVGGKYRLGKKIGSGSFGMSFYQIFWHKFTVLPQVTSISGSILYQERKWPSNWNQLRPSIPNSNMSPKFIKRSLAVSGFLSCAGSAPNATIMPWSSTCWGPLSRIYSTFATASSPSRRFSSLPINLFVNFELIDYYFANSWIRYRASNTSILATSFTVTSNLITS